MSNGGVGRSWRTHAKHALMRSFIGQEVGVVNLLASRGQVSRCVWFDLTAGDGVAPDEIPWEQGCSPGILGHYAANLRVPATVVLSEIATATYDRLLASLAERLPQLGYTVAGPARWRRGTVEVVAVHGSGAGADISIINRDDAVLVLNDPNAITEWAMRPTFAQEVCDRTWRFRSLSTMGCNPAGLKRVDLAERLQWFELIQQQQAALPLHRDLLLTAIERDDAQWAYLIGTASKWRPTTENVARSEFAKVGCTVEMSWYRTDRDLFEAAKRRLFFTRAELREMAVRP